ncbi:MAG: MATE family efflux transporter [Lachnospiraceae bacterium]|nr:MATE family efflux transporter [Lachnospiraceae bacterium]
MEQKEKKDYQEFKKDLLQIALPVTFQCLLQSSFSVVDQIMTGQLGSVSIAAIGLSGKFISLLTVMIQAISAVAGIIIAQAIGKNNYKEAGKGLYSNLFLALILAFAFFITSVIFPQNIMSMYSTDEATIRVAASYLRIYAFSFFPMTLSSLLSAYLRCVGAAKIPLYSGIATAIFNTVLNYLLIFGKFGFPKLEVEGAAWASMTAQFAGLVIFAFYFLIRRNTQHLPFSIYMEKTAIKNYLFILCPMLICEFLWVLGENVYGYIYGHMGTKDCAAMTLINPIVSLMIGALSGVSQAAGIMIGKLLGAGEEEKAYITGKKLIKTGLIGSLILSALLLILNPLYVRIFEVEEDVRMMTKMILIVFAIISPVKVQNMIIGGGILRSGGKTRYVMVIDIIGTWLFGVPMGFLAAFVFNLPIAGVYFALSLEELIRLGISIKVFRKKGWMQQL